MPKSNSADHAILRQPPFRLITGKHIPNVFIGSKIISEHIRGKGGGGYPAAQETNLVHIGIGDYILFLFTHF